MRIIGLCGFAANLPHASWQEDDPAVKILLQHICKPVIAEALIWEPDQTGTRTGRGKGNTKVTLSRPWGTQIDLYPLNTYLITKHESRTLLLIDSYPNLYN